jgi:putative transposase
MPRGARLEAPGTLHHVMVHGIERMNIVEDDDDREFLVTRLGLVTKATGTTVYALAVTSNHAHFLIRS